MFIQAVFYEAALEFLGFGDAEQDQLGDDALLGHEQLHPVPGRVVALPLPRARDLATILAIVFLNYGIDELGDPRLRQKRPTRPGLLARLLSAAERRREQSSPWTSRRADPGAEPLVELDGLVVEYGYGQTRRARVNGISLAIHAGEIVGLAGESGCGKSTVRARSCRSSARRPRRRRQHPVSWRGAARARSRGAAAVPLAERVPRLPERDELAQPGHRVGDQFVDMFKAHEKIRKSEALERAGDLLELVGIDRRRLRAYPHELSGGMRQRVDHRHGARAAAGAPAHGRADDRARRGRAAGDPRGDPAAPRELGFAVLFITHDLSLLVELSDRIAIMYAGDIVELGPGRRAAAAARCIPIPPG